MSPLEDPIPPAGEQGGELDALLGFRELKQSACARVEPATLAACPSRCHACVVQSLV